ncbi:hypothetical protein ACIBMZ_19000 [Micromonospora sp. NPDC049900]|uniref:hypothetical protein n=1 Tax=Micromonospora sp. NPDC049900 TaxID=3364275 RepID=UPI00379D3144
MGLNSGIHDAMAVAAALAGSDQDTALGAGRRVPAREVPPDGTHERSRSNGVSGAGE